MVTEDSRSKHLLRGAVGKRKKNVSILLNNEDAKATTNPPNDGSKGVGKRKNFFSRFIGNRGKNNKVDQAPAEAPGSHYVKV